MTEKDIKPIPNYILKEIHKRDMKIYPWQENIVRFYAYLTVWKKELVKVTVAVSTIKGKQWACKQVAVHGIHSPKCYVCDMEYNYLGHGFNVGWYAEELQSQQKRFEDGKWYKRLPLSHRRDMERQSFLPSSEDLLRGRTDIYQTSRL